MKEGVRVPFLDCVEERAIPSVEPHLTDHVADEHGANGDAQPNNRPAVTAPQHDAHEKREIAEDACRIGWRHGLRSLLTHVSNLGRSLGKLAFAFNAGMLHLDVAHREGWHATGHS